MTRSAHTREYQVFKDLLRSSRKDAGLTQEELAEALGVPQSYVSKYETGERRLDVVELLRVCQVLGVPSPTFIRRLEAQISRQRA
jgi:transcriptional regulator with XRE-family HTH domain